MKSNIKSKKSTDNSQTNYLMIFLLITFPLIGFFVGLRYQQNKFPIVESSYMPDLNRQQNDPIELPKLPPVDRKSATIGYIKQIYQKDNQYFIDVDYAQFYSLEDKTCNGDYEKPNSLPFCNPSGFLIKNDNKQIRTFKLNTNSEIRVLTESLVSEVFVSIEQFKSLFDGNLTVKPNGTIVSNPSGNLTIYSNDAPYWFKTQGDAVTQLWQQYIP